jgi:gamma-glutamylcyclotransferase (GGCT)/AIG2-like uncharacterized protein YtfP
MHEVLASGAELVGPARVEGRLLDLGSYPGAVLVPGCGTLIHGELYRLSAPERVLPLLDRYKGCTDGSAGSPEFRRERHPVMREDGSLRVAWIYLYCRPAGRLAPIPGGDYLRR